MRTISEKAFFKNNNIDSSILFGIKDIFKNKNKIVLSQETSAALWGFSNTINTKIKITVPKGYNPAFKNKIIKVKQRTQNKYKQGIISFMFENQEFKIYSPERTIVELIKEKANNLNDADIETFSNFFKEYNYNIKELNNMAILFNAETEVNIIKKMANHG